MDIYKIIERMRRNWTKPHKQSWIEEDPKRLIFDLSCSFESTGVDEQQLSEKLQKCPADLKAFWALHRSADLFKDEDYGQWGLHILSPTETLVETKLFSQERHRDYQKGDIVCGRFYGDSEFLIMRSNNLANDYGNVVVADPIAHRKDWHVVSETFTAFLETYDRNEGDKYWESSRTQ